MKRYSFRRKLLVYYFSVFIAFLLMTGIFQYFREKTFRTSQLETSLNDITEMSRKYIKQHHILKTGNFGLMDTLKTIFPKSDARVTVVDQSGQVLYDSFVEDYASMDNHALRPEIQKAKTGGLGVSIRRSNSTGREYYYLAKRIDDYFIRSSVIYDVDVALFLKANSRFFYYIIGLFIIVGAVLYLVTKKIGQSISKLQDFALDMGKSNQGKINIEFEDDEIGFIGQQLVNVYSNLQNTQQELSVEKERIYRHLNAVNQGIAIFSSEKELLISNQQFINYANLISDEPLKSESDIFGVHSFKKIHRFINKMILDDAPFSANKKVEKQIKINKGNRYFSVNCILFIDRSFEIIITNITRKEKNLIIKNQMTSNIAHELNTPVSAIQAYLETIIEKPDMDESKKVHFLEKAYGQAERLGLLIKDISTVYKMESTEEVFKKSEINLFDLINEVKDNASLRLQEKNMTLHHDFFPNLSLSANRELILSIFQNLIDNSISYAGKDVDIKLSMYNEDNNYYYFSYSDNGHGIESEHLDRIFERFYRVDEGRTRNTGGTGIGLAIVKNAVIFHRGSISAKAKKGGGIEFLFTLRR